MLSDVKGFNSTSPSPHHKISTVPSKIFLRLVYPNCIYIPTLRSYWNLKQSLQLNLLSSGKPLYPAWNNIDTPAPAQSARSRRCWCAEGAGWPGGGRGSPPGSGGGRGRGWGWAAGGPGAGQEPPQRCFSETSADDCCPTQSTLYYRCWFGRLGNRTLWCCATSVRRV